jgi:aspartate racemase
MRHEPGPSQPQRPAIAIVGLAGIFPGSATVAEYFRNVLRQRCFVRELPEWTWEAGIFHAPERSVPLSTTSRLGAVVGDDLPELDLADFRIPPAVARQMSRNQKLALVCARRALDDAGYLARPFDRERAGVVIAAIAGELVEGSMEAVLARRLRHRMEALARDAAERTAVAGLWDRLDAAHPPALINEDTLPGQVGSLVAGRIASAFDLHGFNETIDSACASSLAAVARGIAALRLGDCDLVIAGGVDTEMSAHAYVQFSKVGALSTSGSFPFDARADGFVMGEGCGIVVLKRLDDAVRAGDRIHAVIRGWGASSDGAGKGITAPSSAGQLLALRRAYADAGISPGMLHYLECHGTGTVAGDAAELASVAMLLQASAHGGAERTAPLPIGSAKSMVGHLKLAAGMAGLFRAVLAVTSRVIPPQVNFERPNTSLDWAASGLTVPRSAELLPDVGPLYAGVSSFGFGGTNHHLVISSAPDRSTAPLVDAAEFIDPSLPALAGDVCLLFPGQGSQYPGMLAGLAADPLVRDLAARATAVCRAAGCPDVAPLLLDPRAGGAAAEARLRDTRLAQPALFVASAILLEKLRQHGVPYAMAIGHSLGELSALHAGGLLSFEEALAVVIERGRLMADCAGDDPGRMAVLHCGRELAAAIVAAVAAGTGTLVCANYNSYAQTVVSGTTPAVAAALGLASERGVAAGELPVARAFHSPLLQASVAALAAAVAATTPRWPRVPVAANRGRQLHPFTADHTAVGQPLAGSERARFIDLVSGQAVRPVDFVAQVELAHAAGIRRFIEVGPRGVLVGLVSDMLQGKPFQTVALDPHADRAAGIGDRLAALPRQLEAPLEIPRSPPAVRRRAVRPPAVAGGPANASPRDMVRQVVAAVSGYAPERITDDAEFERDLGIDTLKIFEIVSRLSGSVLPQRFARLREATSVRRILELAQDNAPRTARTAAGADYGLACYRFETVTRPPDIGAPPDRRYRVIAGGRHGAGDVLTASLAAVVDPTARDVLITMPLPTTPEAVCGQALPELVRLVAMLAEQARTAGTTPEVSVLTFAAADGFHAGGHRAVTAAVKSLQKDARGISLSHAHVDTPAASALLAALLADPRFGRRLRVDGMLEEGRLVRRGLPEADRDEFAKLLGPDDVVLVTGGARGIASLVVRNLLTLVPARFVLVGSRPGGEPWIETEGRGRVEYLAADLCDPSAVARLRLPGRGITLVIHAAGIVRSRPLAAIAPADIRAVMGPKVMGLHHVLGGLDLARLAGIVCFSSAAGYAGGDGHPDYAAANAYLDGFSSATTPVLSIGWSAWDGAGMASDERTRRFLGMAGIELVPAARGVRAFAGLLAEFLRDRTPRTENFLVHAGMAASSFLPRDTTSWALVAGSDAGAAGAPFRLHPLPPRSLVPLDDLPATNALLAAVVEPPAALEIETAGLLAVGIMAADRFAAERAAVLFTPAERGEIDTAGSEKRRREKRSGKLVVKLLAAEWLWRRHGIDIPARAIEVRSGGPPRAGAPGDPRVDGILRDVSCSLSHTDDLVCAALANRSVGVDVERERPVAPEAMARLGCGRASTAVASFTRAEAVLKAAGVGIGAGLDEVAIAADERGGFQAIHRGAEYRVVTDADGEHVWSLAVQTAAPPDDRPRRVEVAVAPGQEALWFLEQLGTIGPALAFGWTERIRGPLDVAALEAALGHLVGRHASLRTVFTSAAGRCRAEVVDGVPLRVAPIDMTHLDPPEAAAEVDRLCRDAATRPFDLEHGPLFRFLVLRRAAGDHVLCCVFHHLVMDVSSALVFRVELAAAYRCLTAGRAWNPPALPMHYADHAARQRARLTAERVDELVAGWRSVLAGRPAEQGVPPDFPRGMCRPGGVASIDVDLPPAVMRGLANAVAEAGVTLFSAFLAAFALVHARLSGVEDVVVGTPFAGRTDPDTLPLVGYFISMLPLRLDLTGIGDGDPSFREILPVARDVVLDAVSRHELPFHMLVERLDPAGDAAGRDAGPPLFRSILRFLHEAPADVALTAAGQAFEELPAAGTLYDLSLVVMVGSDAARCRLEYDTGLFTAATATRIGRLLAAAFAALAADPDVRLSALPLDHEVGGVIEPDRAAADVPRPLGLQGIDELFAAQVVRTPSAVAVSGRSATLSYQQLDEAANRLAHVLARLGAGPGSCVGLLLERSVGMVVGMLAALKAGAAYLPLDPEYPPERLAFMLSDVGATVVVSLGRHLERLPTETRDARPIVCLDRDAAVLRSAAADPCRPHRPVPPTDQRVACVLYTSGSSGVPKGVAVTHRGIVRLFAAAAAADGYVGLGPDDVLLHLSPPSFDAATFEVWGALLHGGRCVVVEDQRPDLRGLGALVIRHRVSVLWLTTPLFNVVVDHAPEILRGVRHVLTGGEAASLRHFRRARARFPHLRLTNCYGPTECTTFACTYDVPQRLDEALQSIPIGRPIDATTVRLLDRRGRLVRPGVVGEIVLGGAGVALGYVNRAALTAEKFVTESPPAEPTGGRPGTAAGPAGRLYRTGDLARLLPDGNLEFVGRLDDQVKVRGHRVEPGEVEAAIRRHPDVRDAAVVATADAGGQARLVAFVVPVAGTGDEPAVNRLGEDLQARLRRSLPAYLVPEALVMTAGLPLTPHGKIDRRRLAAEAPLRGRPCPAVRPTNPTEALVARLWADLLGLPAVGMTDDFFALGGTSLSAVVMASKVEQILGSRLPLTALFSDATVAGVTRALVDPAIAADALPLVALGGSGTAAPLFFLHGDLFGGGLYCRSLARAIGDEVNLVAIHPHGLAGQPELGSIEAMAAAHVEAIRRVQPAGPYRLGGYCNGALEAFEIARQLVQAGADVSFVALVAPPQPGHGGTRPSETSAHDATGDSRAGLLRRFAEACAAYTPTFVPVPITVVQPADDHAKADDRAGGWGSLAPDVTVELVPGTHATAVALHADTIGSLIRARLGKA